MFERSFLEPFAGQYGLAGVAFTITLRGEYQLVGTFPGQPARELVSARGAAWDLKGWSGCSSEFWQDPSDKIAGAVLDQPGETLVVKRE